METFGYAALQIIPSMSGATKTLDRELNGMASQSGARAGETMGRGIGRGLGRTDMGVAAKFQATGQSISGLGDSIASVGGQITRSITVPIGGATLAAGGLVAALGWKRLVSVDTAQAQLKGLGYSTEDVTRISGQLSTALEGGMLTMGEATSAAAAGMAAGVDEGKELTRYIQLLDAATAGSNGTFDEMNQIFARVQGSGQLMTNELQMMEQRMPGFTGKMAEAAGVTQDAFREMVAAGEVSADDFLDLFEGFGSEMAREYAKSWEGMVQNTFAYIGIIGQALLGGVFEQSKDALAEFIQFLDSPAIQEGAAELGVVLGDVFAGALGLLQEAIGWFLALDPGMQKTILGFVGIAVAAGPVLLVVGKVVGVFGGLVSGAGTVIGVLGRIPGPLNILGGLFRTGVGVVRSFAGILAKIPSPLNLLGGLFRIVTGAMRGLFTAMLANPIGLIITAIGLLVAGLAYFFTQTEEGQAMWADFMVALEPAKAALEELISVIGGLAGEIMPMLADAGMQIMDALQPLVTMIVGELLPIIAELAITLISTILPVIIELVSAVLPLLVSVIMAVVPSVLALIEAFLPLVTTIISLVIPIIQNLLVVITTVFDAIVPIIQAALRIVIGVITLVLGIITGDWSRAWDGIKMILSGIWDLIVSVIRGAIKIVSQVISSALSAISAIWSSVWSGIRGVFSAIWSAIVSAARGFLNAVVTGFTTAMTTIGRIPGQITQAFAGAGRWLINAGKSIIDGLVQGIRNSISRVTNAVSDVMSAARDFLPFSPAKRGPFAGRGWTTHSGLAIGEGLAEGIGKSTTVVQRAAESLADAAAITVRAPVIEEPAMPDPRGMTMDGPRLRSPYVPSLRDLDRAAASREEDRRIELVQYISTQDPEAAAQRSSRLIMAGLR